MANTAVCRGVALMSFAAPGGAYKRGTRESKATCPVNVAKRPVMNQVRRGPQFLTGSSSPHVLYQKQPQCKRRATVGTRRAVRSELKTYEEAPPQDGQSRFYMNPMCPYAQRSWIGVKYKGLEDRVESVEVDLRKMPQWYKDLYPVGKVPSLEHNGEVTGESLDVLRYLDAHFDGPKMEPTSEEDRATVQKLLEFCDKDLVPVGFGTASLKDASPQEYKQGMKPVLDVLERQLEATEAAGKGPYLLGDFSTADAAIVPFLWRFQFILENFRSLDLFEDHPRLSKYFKSVSEQAFFAETKPGHERMHATYKMFLDNDYFGKIGLARKPATSASA